eukprot:COSAG02_NODE_4681_length_5103_cov_2.175659_2_plen_592_part_00
MSLYWSADDSVKVGETKISIPSENGLNYSPGQKVQLFVDPSTKFMDGRETYLEFNVKLSLPSGKAPTRLQLDKAGASVLIRNIRIYDGSRGNLLEEVNAYDTYVAVKYDYDKDRNAENMRALREGSSVYQPGNRGDSGTTQSAMANTLTNPYFKQTTGDQSASFSDSDFLTAKVCVPLHTGIFANSDTIFPVMMTGGLYMEIDLNDAPAVIKQLDSVLLDRKVPLNPVFHSLNGSSTPDTWVNGSAATTFYVDTDNSISGADRVAKFPFVVGETIGFALSNNNGSLATLSATATISQINSSSSASGGTGLVEVVLDASITNNGVTIDQNFALFSTAVSSQTSYDATYAVSNVNLVVSQIQLDPAYEQGMIQKVRDGKAIEFDIQSLTNYKHSILASDRQTTFQIFSQNSRARSLLVVPVDSTVYTSAQQISGSGCYMITGTDSTNACATSKNADDVALANNRSQFTGVCDQLSSIQYTIDGGMRVPSREISTKKIATKNSLDAFHLFELEKTLDAAGIPPKSFTEFMNNFCFGRSFGAGSQKGVMDLRGKDLAVILKYQTATAPSVGKLFNSYVFHIRRLVLRDGGVDVVA